MFVARKVQEEICFNESLGFWVEESHVFVLESIEITGRAIRFRIWRAEYFVPCFNLHREF